MHKKTVAVRLESITPEFNRCLRFNTSRGVVRVKVIADGTKQPTPADLKADRDLLVAALTSPSMRGVRETRSLATAGVRAKAK